MSDERRVTIHDVLDDLRDKAKNTVEQGHAFERLVVEYLKKVAPWKDRFDRVERWPDHCAREGIDAQDTGIDIVARERDTGALWAIQAKFHARDHDLQFAEIATFLATSSTSEYAHRLLACTCGIGDTADKQLSNPKLAPPCQVLGLSEFEESPVDWAEVLRGSPGQLSLRPRKTIRKHQREAIDKVKAGFAKADRGRLIMACGTGKTFTSLKLAEETVPKGGAVLFLAPSLALVSQTLHEWATEVSDETPMRHAAVCSDRHITRGRGGDAEDSGEILRHELSVPPTTDPEDLAEWLQARGPGDTAVVYCTYHSLRVVREAQEKFPGAVPKFDLVICDEAHRTAGTKLAGKESTGFSLIHDAGAVKARKRLYMTATPKVYAPTAVRKTKKAGEQEAVVYSMDDESVFGKELHRLGFADAVEGNLLSDYHVMVLAVDREYTSRELQEILQENATELNLGDAARIVGCINGLAKHGVKLVEGAAMDDKPMRRAVAFFNRLKASRLFVQRMEEIADKLRRIKVRVRHVDGAMSASKRNRDLSWLKRGDDAANPPTCHILSNAKCLSEGVDVPALDAVMFLQPRSSQVDVVQAVGRVMRAAPGKKCGYVIIPIVISLDAAPEQALDNNEEYAVVWRVLQALRSHDENFDIVINRIDLCKKKSEKISVQVIGPKADDEEIPEQMQFQFDAWEKAIYGKIVERCGTRGFWQQWARGVGVIAHNHIVQIERLLEDATGEARDQFDQFLGALQKTLNPSITEKDAVGMLAQHLVTRPVFEALFEDYEFVKHNPVSQAMQAVLDLLEARGLKHEREIESLNRFYRSIRRQLQGIDEAEGRQKIISELYDSFFKVALKKEVKKLGIVYTPTEIIDFILRSANEVLQEEFGTDLAGEGVHIMDPFTGTGTFLTRLIQSGLIPPEALKRKYGGEMHAIEIVLLAYYIAAINIEEAYHGVVGGAYKPFEGILLADTFQMHEEGDFGDTGILPGNTARAEAQKKAPIRVIIGNPPYSARQGSENDANRNLNYKNLSARVRETYTRESTARNNNSLRDSYVRAIRLASDRIDEGGKGGVIGFVTNSSFLDSQSMDGLRKCLAKEFSAIHVLNLRGSALLKKGTTNKEGEKIFGSGSRLPVAILILVKKLEHEGPATIHYGDIGDGPKHEGLKREEKLRLLKEWKSIGGTPDWRQIIPNAEGDWINKRGKGFTQFMPMGDSQKRGKGEAKAAFVNYSMGPRSNREWWGYNFSAKKLEENLKRMVRVYEEHRARMQKTPKEERPRTKSKFDAWVDNDPKRIKWSDALKQNLLREIKIQYDSASNTVALYRPFTRKHLGYEPKLIERMYQHARFFPTPESKNLVIVVSGKGAKTDFSAIMTDVLPDHSVVEKGQCFPLYTWEKSKGSMLEGGVEDGLCRKDNISDHALEKFRAEHPDLEITKEDIFHYIYGVLHSPEYRKCFNIDLRKELPHIPMAHDFALFRDVGKRLGQLHVGYESAKPFKGGLVDHVPPAGEDPWAFYAVEGMDFPGKRQAKGRSAITYNENITLQGIPEEAYEYAVNGRSAIEWVMDQYRVKTDGDSGIVQDPNLWAKEAGKPSYIYDLLRSVIAVSIETLDLVARLPTEGSFREPGKKSKG